MKNSKGFTMIELIAVFLIIAALSVVGVVTVNAIMAKIEENYYADIEQELLLAGSEYYSDNQRDRPVDSYNKVELGTLIDNKYIEQILDKNGNDSCEGNVYIYKNAAKYDYQACLSCGKKSDGTYTYQSGGAYCNNTVADVIFVDAINKDGSPYSSALSYENTDWSSSEYLTFTFSMNNGVVSKYVITNLSTLEKSDCIATNNSCTKKINTTGSYSVTAYGSEGNVIGSSKYFNAKFDRNDPTFDVTISGGKFRYGFDEKSYHFSSKIINLKDDNGIKSVTYTLTGTKVIAQNEDITNTLSIDKDLPSGRYTLTVKATDVAGNTTTFTGSEYIEVIMPVKIIYTDIEGNVFDKGYKEVVNGLAYNYSSDFAYGYNTKYTGVEAYYYLDNAKKNRIYSTSLVDSHIPYTIYAFDSYILQAPPTKEEYCLNPTYNGNTQVITKAADVGYSFSNNIKTDYSASGYNVVAKLGNLYMWTTLNRDDVIINCNIMPKKITVTSTNKTYTFDNAEHKSNACTADKLVTGHSVTCTNSGTITKVGTASNPITNVVIKDGSGNNVTKNYTITKNSGTLAVNARPVTVSTGNVSCKYSKCGSSEANSAISSTKFSNLVSGWKGSVTTKASEITTFLTGKPAGSYTIYDGMDFAIKDENGVDITNQCSITYSPGNLKIDKYSVAVPTALCKSGLVYNGNNQTIASLSGDASTYAKFTNTADVTKKNAGSYTVTATLKDKTNTTWSDGSTSDKSATCRIAKATPEFTIISSDTVIGTKVKKFTATTSIEGSVSVSSSDTGSLGVSVTGGPETKFVVTLSPKNKTATITVTAIFTPVDTNYNSVTKTITVSAFKLAEVGSCVTGLVYNKNSQKIATDGTGVTVTGNNQTKAGSYTVKYTPQTGYKFEDGSTSAKSISCSIAKAGAGLSLSPTSGTVIGTAQKTFVVSASVPGIFKYSNSNTSVLRASTGENNSSPYNWVVIGTGTNSGSSTITVSFTPDDTVNYSTASKSATVTVYREAQIGTCNSLKYTGSDQTLVSNSAGVTLTNNTRKDVGSQTVTATVQDGYKFSDGKESKTISCSIEKADPTVSLSRTSLTLIGSNSGTVTLTSNVEGSVTVTSSNSTAVTAGSVGSGKSITITAGGKNAQATTSTITVRFTPTNTNYNSVTKTISVTTYKAAQTGKCNTGLTYNGTYQTLATGGTGVTVSGNSQKNAGTYKVTYTANTDYKFADGSQDSQQIDCGIAKASTSFSVSPGSKTLIGSASGSFTASSNAAGSISVSSSNSNISASGNGSISANGTKSISVSASNYTGSSTITVNFTPTDSTNYTSKSATVSVSAYKSANPGSCVANLRYNGKNQTVVSGGVGVTYTTTSFSSVGSHLVTVTANNGYLFSDNTGSKLLNCEIKKGLATNGSCKSLTFNGSSQTLASGGTNITFSNNSGTNATSYTVTATANTNYEFSDGKPSQTLNCSIERAKTATTGSCNTVVYNGGNRELASGGSHVTYSNNYRTSAGSQTVTVTADSNYAFSDGKLSKTLSCTIYSLATTGTCKSLTFNGSSQTLASGGTGVTYSNNTRTNAGSQNVTVTANSGYKFSDGSASQTLNCSIERAKTATTGSCNTVVYNGGNRELASGGSHVTYSNNYRTSAGSQTVTVTADSNYAFSDGKLSKTLSCTIYSLATTGTCKSLTYNGSSQTLASGGDGVTYSNNTRTNAGSQTVTITANSGYKFSDGSASQTLSCSIAKSKTANPGTCVSGLVYNGKSQTLMSGAVSASYSNNTRTNAGSQTVTITADSNHLFVGGEASTTVSCSIAKKPATITAASCTLEYDGKSKTCGGCTAAGIVDSAIPTYSCSSVVKTSVGSYTVPAGGTISSNYNVTLVNGTLKIQDTTKPACSLAVNKTSGAVSVGCSDASGCAYAGFSSSYSGSTSKTINATTTVTAYVKDNNGNTNSCSKKFTKTVTTTYKSRTCSTPNCALYGGYSSSTSYVTSCTDTQKDKGGKTSYVACSSQTIYYGTCASRCCYGTAQNCSTSAYTSAGTGYKGTADAAKNAASCKASCSGTPLVSSQALKGSSSTSGYKKTSYTGGSCTSYSCSAWGSWSSRSSACTSKNPASSASDLIDCSSDTTTTYS